MTGSAHQALDVVFRKLNLRGRESEGGVGSRSGLGGSVVGGAQAAAKPQAELPGAAANHKTPTAS